MISSTYYYKSWTGRLLRTVHTTGNQLRCFNLLSQFRQRVPPILDSDISREFNIT